MLRNGFCFNKACNQLYTPFHDAVRHGSVELVSYLLDNFLKDHPKIDSKSLININQPGGFSQNSVFHLAASRTKYEVFFELDKYKADIFARNREFKSVFQHVNCN